MFLDWNEVSELEYYSDKELDLGNILYQIYNCYLWKSANQESFPLTVIAKDEWSNFPQEFKQFEIISFEFSYGENEGEQVYRFVLKTPSKDYFEFEVFTSSWDGPEYSGPTPVYPKQTTIYVTKENY